MKRWATLKHWSPGAQVILLMLNALACGSTASEIHDGTWTWFALIALPMNAVFTVWIASTIWNERVSR